MHDTPLRPMRQHAAIDYIPTRFEHKCRSFCVYYQPSDDTTKQVHIHNNCVQNELVALRNRVLFAVPDVDPQALRRLKPIARAIADWIPREQLDEDWWQRYSGAKRRRYREASESLQYRPLSRRDARIAAFVKPEKVFEIKDPRLIQARSPRYNIKLGNYLKPIEHHLYRLKGSRRLRRILPPGRVIAKGLNMKQRATLITEKWHRFAQPAACVLDASRFDAHVQEILRIEHLVYRRYWKSPELDQLLEYQIRNRGRTAGGIKYRCMYGRMSGDMNTALGNCLISVIMAAAYMKTKKIDWDFVCDGDDAIIFVDRRNLSLLDDLEAIYAQWGFVMKRFDVTRIEDLRFCQAFICESAVGPKMVQVPERTLSRALVGIRHWNEPKFRRKYLSLIGYCELALNAGIPVLQEFALMAMQWGDGFPTKWLMSGHAVKALREEATHRVQPLPITPEARVCFEQATGITVEAQRALEGAFRTLARVKDATKTQISNTQTIHSETTDHPPKEAWGKLEAISQASGEHSKAKAKGPLWRLARFG